MGKNFLRGEFTGALLEPGQQWPGFLLGAASACERSEYRLVKAPKSPTEPSGQKITRDAAATRTPEGTPGAFAVLQFREWSQEWRFRTRAEPLTFQQPMAPEGPRITDDLTERGARKIMESCQYVATVNGGYSTFLTLTLDQPARERLKAECLGPFCTLDRRDVSWLGGYGRPGWRDAHQHNRKRVESTIQAELSRFLDALQKIYQRGMVETCPETGATVEIAGHADGLQYVWVAEVPDTVDPETGEIGAPNPHVHVLLRWRVPRAQFRAWAARIERLWGQGFAHLEKVKDGTAAAAYMMKAAGYLCKAQGKPDQGRIRGNRYAISKPARAPSWITVQEYQLHTMGCMIADVHQHLTEVHGEDYKMRKVLKRRLDAVPKGTRLRRIIGKQLEKVRARLERVPVVASKYQILFKDAGALALFLGWAKDARGTPPAVSWLPHKGAGEVWRPGERPDTRWFDRFKENHYWRRACRAAARMAWSDWEWGQAVGEYEQWGEIADALAYDCP